MSIILSVDHEENDFSDYSGVTDPSSRLSITGSAALAGTNYGMACLAQSQVHGYAYVDSLNNTSGILRCRIYLHPNLLTMGVENFTVLRFYNTADEGIATLTLSFTAGSVYQIAPGLFIDGSATAVYAPAVTISNAEHYIEFMLVRATGESTNDGYLSWWLDDVEQTGLTGQDNYTKFANVDEMRAGLVTGLDVGTSGTFYLDQIVANDDGSEIGQYEGGGITINLDPA